MPLSVHYIQRVVKEALEEDSAFNDVTTLSTIGRISISSTANLVAKQNGIIAGIQVAEQAFKILDINAQFIPHIHDGQDVVPGAKIATIAGNAADILSAERTALNFLQRMSGIASLTARYVSVVKGTNAKIVDTRKTIPGLRVLDKYSVSAGGGGNHRASLSDCILIKDNHIAAMRKQGMSISDILHHTRANAPFSIKIEIEVETVADALDAMRNGADIVMLDNMSTSEMRDAVTKRCGQTLIEASGNVTLETVLEIAKTGVDIISVGELTHSVTALDISLDFTVE